MIDLVVLGVGFPDIVQTIEDIIDDGQQVNFLGFLDDKIELHEQSIVGYPVLGSLNWLESGGQQLRYFNSVGRSMETRAMVSNRADSYGAKPASLVHPTVNTRYTELSDGVLLSKNVYIEPRTTIGTHCIVMPNVTIGHDTVIGDNCFIASGCHLGGSVKIGEKCLVGAGSSIHPAISVGARSKIGVNSVVMRNIKPGGTAFSRPAEVI